ncbi:MAG: hypothetical protein LRY27_03860 [Chitinophagales bacterium]|nr:hypothetical protein [Chitinophagales bacterium]
MKQNIAALFIFLFVANFLFAQNDEKVKVKFKDYGAYVDDVLYLDASCKKYYGDPCTFSLAGTGQKAFVVKSKEYTILQKVFDKYSKTWSEVPGKSSYLQITFIETGEEMYATTSSNNFIKKVYAADIFNSDGTLNSEKLKLFILENSEEEPRGIGY